jgi:hypothetical protein
VKNQPICVSVPSQPCEASSASIGNAHSSAPDAKIAVSRAPRKRACAGVGVSSSIRLGAAVPAWPAASCAALAAKAAGSRRPAIAPTSAAAITISGNGASNAKIATNEAVASAHSRAFFSVRVRCATRHAARWPSPRA